MDARATMRWFGWLLGLLMAAPAWALDCSFEQRDDTDAGFTAVVKLKNRGSLPVVGWTARLGFPDGATITQVRNASLSGSNPYEAENSLFNALILPGRAVQFSFDGLKAWPGEPLRAPLLGGICDPGYTNTPPHARATAQPTVGTAPLAVQFDGRESLDIEGDALSYRWAFGDGGTSSEAAPSHVYSAAGTYTATLTVNDGQADSPPAEITITVSEPVTVGEVVRCEFRIANEWPSGYTAEVKIHNHGTEAIDGWAVSVDYPGGTRIAHAWNTVLGGQAPNYVARNAGWNARIGAGSSVAFGYNTAKPQTGAPGEVPSLGGLCTADGGPPNRAPVAQASVSPDQGVAPLTVRFDGSTSSDPDGDALSHRWVFDDGSEATTAVVERNYAAAGQYSATLTVSDGELDSEPVTVSVTVSEPAEPGSWTLDASRSSLHFVSTKKLHVIETHTFGLVDGGISPDGIASLRLHLDSIDSGIAIRDERMREHLFQTEQFPESLVTLDITPLAIDAIAVGASAEHTVELNVDLHGFQVPVEARLRVTRLAPDTLLVQNLDPVRVHAESFGLVDGIETLRSIAGLSSISYAVPVNVTLVYVSAEGQP